MEPRKGLRMTRLFTALIVFGCQIWILSNHKWSIIAMYVHGYHSWPVVLVIWFHLWWGIYNLVQFINYKVDYKEMGDIGKKDEDGK